MDGKKAEFSYRQFSGYHLGLHYGLAECRIVLVSFRLFLALGRIRLAGCDYRFFWHWCMGDSIDDMVGIDPDHDWPEFGVCHFIGRLALRSAQALSSIVRG